MLVAPIKSIGGNLLMALKYQVWDRCNSVLSRVRRFLILEVPHIHISGIRMRRNNCLVEWPSFQTIDLAWMQ